MALPFTSLYIDGEWRPASGGATFNVFRPSSEDIVGTAAAATAADCTAAVEAAARRRGQDSIPERAHTLVRSSPNAPRAAATAREAGMQAREVACYDPAAACAPIL